LYDTYRHRGVEVIAYNYEPEWAVAQEKVEARGMATYNRADMPILFRADSTLQFLPREIVILDEQSRVVRVLDYDMAAVRATLNQLLGG
jgi:hypothetical protein